ncbi:hypothetical protein [Phnomibacter sp. MR]|uniref:hypothetical protein n=1 Tax=Phnomibacter sp. MR TaxID=3042318 RepID=UPI003A80049F
MPPVATTSKHENYLSILKALGILPLIIYPFVLLPNLMALGGHGGGSFTAKAFIYSSTFYPVTLIASLWFNKQRKLIIAALPLFHLGFCILFYWLW